MTLPPPPGSISRAPAQAVAPRSSVKFDDDQMAVIECSSKNIVVEAKAGSGKTTTAEGYTAARKSSNFLYVCFGKKNQEEAKARFGPHVECRTGHSLAYEAVGYKFKDQITMKWYPRILATNMRLTDMRTAAILQGVLNQYFVSTDKALMPHHVEAVSKEWGLADSETGPLLVQAKLVWSKMQQVGSGVMMPPDAYVKIWALSKPKLTKYTHIILDEAQDTAPVFAQIIEEQTHAHKLLLGDRHQSIYLFRGAMNAMEEFAASGSTVLQMPKTWRFGPQIAHIANELLGFFKNEDTKIIGAGPGSARRPENKCVVLSRTNAGLYGEAAAVMGKNTHWVGGIEQYRVESLIESYLLKADRRHEIKDPNFKAYGSWQHYVDTVAKTRDGEGRMLIKLNETHGRDIPYLVKCFKANALATEAGASLVLTTGHKGKGMDWDHVKIGDDFACLIKALDVMKLSPLAPLSAAQAQEINLLYVVATRARHRLDLNTETKDFLRDIAMHRGSLQEARAKFAPHSTDSEQPQPQP